MQPAIKAQGLFKSFRAGFFKPPKEVLQGVDLEVASRSIFGILGPNGAGKTTLISILTTLLIPDRGRATVLGLDTVKDAARLRERINLTSSGARFLWSLTVEESLRFYGRLYGLGGRELTVKVEELLQLFGLMPHRQVKFENLSTGLKQRLFAEFRYAAKTWKNQLRVIARIEHSQKGANPRYIVTNLPGEGRYL